MGNKKVRTFVKKEKIIFNFDDIVFDALGLTEKERKEVYWAVAELVKNRLEKARSV